MSRGGHKISRDTEFSSIPNEEPSWMDDYLEAVKKYSVKTKKEDDALFNQINSILGINKSKYSSVEEAVLDMQKRTGLLDLLQKKASEVEPQLFSKAPNLKTFIDNHVSSFPGTSVDAVVFNIMKVPSFKSIIPSGEDVDDDVKGYINSKIMQANPNSRDLGDLNFGKADVEIDALTVKDNNPLNILTPVSF